MLLRGELDEGFAVNFQAAPVDPRQALDKLSLPAGILIVEHQVNKLVHARALGSRRVGLRNDHLRQSHHYLVLMRVEEEGFPTRAGVAR